jgi:hypothetical protein
MTAMEVERLKEKLFEVVQENSRLKITIQRDQLRIAKLTQENEELRKKAIRVWIEGSAS